MDDLERRVREALLGLPDADPATRERAVNRAIELTTPRPARTRRRLTITVALAAAVAVGAGAALAATRAIDVPIVTSDRTPTHTEPRSKALTLPPSTNGVAAVVGGRLHLRTRSGVGIDGLPARTADLSPNALYVAVGLDGALTALSPSGRTAWTQNTRGTVTEIAWSPYPVWIAYIVTTQQRSTLHVIQGDGDHDQVAARDVDRTRPYWSADGNTVNYSRDGRWYSFTPSTGTRREGPACTSACPQWIPASTRALLRREAFGPSSLLTTARDGADRGRSIAAVRRPGGKIAPIEIWWTPAGGPPRLLMRAPARWNLPVHLSIR